LNTLPAEPVAGYVISDRFPISKHAQMGWAPNDEGITFPPHLLQELGPLKREPNAIDREELKRLATFTDEEWDMLLHWEQDPENVRGNAFVNLKYAYQSTGTIGDVGLHMLENHPQPNLLLIYLELPDRVQHQFWGFWDPEVASDQNRNPPERIDRFKGIVPGSYEFVDEIIGSFLARMDPDTTVFLISDHGMTSNHHDGWLPEDPINVDSTGTHHRRGVLIAAGPAIAHGTKGRAMQLDIAPTVLAALGLPGSTQFGGGHVLKAILDPAFLAEHPQAEPIDEPPLVRSNVHVPRGMDEDYVDQLKAIGYIGTDGEDN